MWEECLCFTLHLGRGDVSEKIAIGLLSGSVTQKRQKPEMLQTDEGQNVYGSRIRVIFQQLWNTSHYLVLFWSLWLDWAWKSMLTPSACSLHTLLFTVVLFFGALQPCYNMHISQKLQPGSPIIICPLHFHTMCYLYYCFFPLLLYSWWYLLDLLTIRVQQRVIWLLERCCSVIHQLR